MDTTKKILVVEDQYLIRKGIVNIIEDSKFPYLIYEATNMQNAINIAHYRKPNLILMDLQLGDGTGAEACRIILDELPKTKVLFLSMHDDETSVLAALLSGASGYLLKNISPQTLINSMSLTLQGFSIFNQKSLPYLLNASKAKEIAKVNSPLIKLSTQQTIVLEYVTQGLTNKEIRKVMSLSDKTIRNYLSIIFEKLGISKRTEAAVIYIESNPNISP